MEALSNEYLYVHKGKDGVWREATTPQIVADNDNCMRVKKGKRTSLTHLLQRLNS